MFWLYKVIIRLHINENFYPTAHFLKSSFHVSCYYLSIFYLVARPFSVKTGNARHTIRTRAHQHTRKMAALQDKI
jgi:hypothetical protein